MAAFRCTELAAGLAGGLDDAPERLVDRHCRIARRGNGGREPGVVDVVGDGHMTEVVGQLPGGCLHRVLELPRGCRTPDQLLQGGVAARDGNSDRGQEEKGNSEKK